jgi:bacteriocin biosynthesis cyclodehydratase domain-containing protein
VVGLVQATEAVKLILGIGEPLIGRLLTYDALGMRFREVKLRRDPHCPLCGTAPTIHDLSIHREGTAACEIAPNGHGEPATATVPTVAAAPAQRAGG